jgi:hypothetical protein
MAGLVPMTERPLFVWASVKRSPIDQFGFQGKPIDAIQTPEVHAEFVRKTACPMKRIDPTGPAEIVLRYLGMELVERQVLFAFEQLEVVLMHVTHDGPFAPT